MRGIFVTRKSSWIGLLILTVIVLIAAGRLRKLRKENALLREVNGIYLHAIRERQERSAIQAYADRLEGGDASA